MKSLSKIEDALLERELSVIKEGLEGVGTTIAKIFNKYGTINGSHKDELIKYIQAHVLSAREPYFSGYTTQPHTNSQPGHIPDCIKQLVLDWAVADFFEKFDDIQSVVEDIETG